MSPTYLLAFKLGGQPPVEWAGQPAGVEVPGVQQHVAALLVNSGHDAPQVGLSNHGQEAGRLIQSDL